MLTGQYFVTKNNLIDRDGTLNKKKKTKDIFP